MRRSFSLWNCTAAITSEVCSATLIEFGEEEKLNRNGKVVVSGVGTMVMKTDEDDFDGQVRHEQSLVVAVSQTAQPGAAVAPLDPAGPLLLHPSLMAATCHAATAAATLSLAVSAHMPLTVNTAVPTTMLPLGVVVSSDVSIAASLSKVRQLSPEMAKNLLQQPGW